MGTDIHIQIEVRKKGAKNWKWLGAKLPKGVNHWNTIPISRDRNYDLFAILANVRNGYGFAGCPTSSGFKFISEPKGLPKDISKELKAAHDKDGLLGDHSFSWLTSTELSSFDWKQTVKEYGVVGEEQFKEFKLKGKPSTYCGDVQGPKILHVSNKIMEKIISGKYQKSNGMEYYTRVEWESSYIDAVGWGVYYEYSHLDNLLTYDDRNKYEIRIVFGFDS